MTDADKSKSDSAGAFGTQPMSGPDFEKLVVIQRKNIETIMQANEYALDGIHAAWSRHIESVNQIVECYAAMLDERALTGPLRDRFAKYSDFSKRILEKNTSNTCDVTMLLASAANRAVGVLAKRFIDGLSEASVGVPAEISSSTSKKR
jgi:hypothetical protein